MNVETVNLLKEHTLERDRIELAAGDVLDVKAGLLLVMLIFLAGQTDSIFAGTLSAPLRVLELVSVSGLVIGGVLAIWQLIPKKYGVLSHPEKYEGWLKNLPEYFAEHENPEAAVARHAEHVEIGQAIERVKTNNALNKKKASLAKVCFYCVITSFAANVFALIAMHLFQLHR